MLLDGSDANPGGESRALDQVTRQSPAMGEKFLQGPERV